MTALIPTPQMPQSDTRNQLASDVRRALLSEDGLQVNCQACACLR